jgi:hypothetical protein
MAFARPKVTVHLQPGTITAGTAFDSIIRLESRRKIPVETIDCRFWGTASTVLNGRAYEDRRIVDLRAEATPKHLPAGPWELRVRFAVPANAPPAYSGTSLRIEYLLSVSVDVPWWFDRESQFVIPVIAPPAPAAAPGPSSLIADHDSGVRVECALDRSVLAPGGVVAGRVAFWRTRASELGAVKLRLRCVEETPFGAIDGANFIVELPLPRHIDGEAHTFRMKIPESAVPAFHCTFGSTRWRLDVEAKTRLGEATLLAFPLNVVAKESAGLEFFSKLPLIGDQRRGRMLSRIARRTGLHHDVDTDRLLGELGAVSVSLEREHATGRNRIELRWRPLAIGLSVGASRWSDALSPEEITVGHAAFDERFQVRGREPSQVVAAIAPFVEAHDFIRTLDDLTIRDDGASLSAPSVYDEESLTHLAYSALKLAERMRAACESIVPASFVAPHHDEWRALAERHQGRFRPGDGALLQLQLLTERASLEHAFDRATVRETILRVPLDPPMQAPPDRERPDSIRAEWREQLAGLESSGARWIATSSTLELRVAPVAAPREAERWIERIVAAARVLQGRRDTGPFR